MYVLKTSIIALLSMLMGCGGDIEIIKTGEFYQYPVAMVLDAELSDDAAVVAILAVDDLSYWRTTDYQQLSEWQSNTFSERQYYLSLAANKKVIATAGKTTVNLLNTSTNELIDNWQVKGFSEDAKITSLRLNHSGNKVYIGLNEGSIISVDLVNNTRSLFKLHDGAVTKLLLSEDGKEMLSSGRDGLISRWATDTGRQIFEINSRSRITSMAFDHSSQKIFFSDALKAQQIKDLDSLTTSTTLEYFERFQCFREALFSADGRRLITTTPKYQIAVWNVESGLQIKEANIRAKSFGSTTLDISTDINGNVYTISSDGILEIWIKNNILG